MAEEAIVAGEAPVEKPQGVETIVPVAPLEQELAEMQSRYEALEAEKVRLEAEKNNYRKGMLKAKGKADDDYAEPEEDDERIRRIMREELLNSDAARVQTQQQELIKSLLNKNKEMATALRNKAQMTPSGGSSADDGKPSKDNFWSPEQLADLKARGLDPEKVKANMLKNREKAGI